MEKPVGNFLFGESSMETIFKECSSQGSFFNEQQTFIKCTFISTFYRYFMLCNEQSPVRSLQFSFNIQNSIKYYSFVFRRKKNTRHTFFLFCATKLFYLYLISSHFIFTFTKILSIIIIYSVYK